METLTERPTEDSTVRLSDKDFNEILRSFNDDQNELKTYTEAPYIVLPILWTCYSRTSWSRIQNTVMMEKSQSQLSWFIQGFWYLDSCHILIDELKYYGPNETSLTHCGLVTPYGDIDLGQHWLR